MPDRYVPVDGPRAREHRLAAGIPLRRIARAMDTDTVTVADMEACLRQPSTQQVTAWADALGWSTGRLLAEPSRPYRVLDLDRPVPGGVR